MLSSGPGLNSASSLSHLLAELAEGRAVIPRAGAASLLAVTPRGAASVGADLALDAADLLSAWQL